MQHIRLPLLAAILLTSLTVVQAQYFGRNKPNYENFDFTVVQSPNFELYHYLDNEEYINEFIHQAEEWYHQHQHILDDTIKQRNPFILYADHTDFQQTNAVSGSIGVGTGGVTEAFKNRVIMPIAMSNQQTHHVLGHELVHAFQYNMVINGDSTSLRNLSNLPLWMVEGLAEYLSIGSVDAHTAMWMRDAVLHDEFPTLKELNNPKYFPYRYGQMFWVFVTGLKGDDVIAPLFRETAKYGFDVACVRQLGMTREDLSKLWKNSIDAYYKEMIGDRKENFVGREIISPENGGRINIAPEVSPNGRYVIFLSEKDIFGIDLFLAEAHSGKIIRKVSSSTRTDHIDDFNYIESSGTWSPRSDRFAFVGISKGDNVLIISDVQSGKTLETLRIPGVPAFSNPTWSPDGNSIVVSGLVNGQIDLYQYNLRSQQVTQLTDDVYSELHPAWSPDGARLHYATDELSMRNAVTANGKWHFNLATRDMVSGVVDHHEVFSGADNLNPEEDAAGNIVFLSNRDGYRNLYRFDPTEGTVTQLTDLITGVSGITHYAPAFSIDRSRDRLVYTYFSSQGYRLYSARAEDLIGEAVDPQAVDMQAAQLPRVNRKAPRIVDPALAKLHSPANDTAITTIEVPYKSKFKLDYVGGGGGIGVGTSQSFGTTTGLAGGIDLLFSDMLGTNQFFTSLSLNGELIDVGGTVAYINRNNRVNWGVSLSHIPFRSFAGSEIELRDTIDVSNGQALVDRQSIFEQRIFQDQLGVFAQLPFSTTTRVEFNSSYALYSGRIDQRDYYYQPNTFFLVGQDRNRIDKIESFRIGQVEAALVGDNSSFGVTAPLNGQRYRLGVGRYFDAFSFTSVTADYRRYKYLRPVTLAFRATHQGRYGGNSEDLFPQYVGFPWFVRGLNTAAGQEVFLSTGRSIEELTGSKLLVSSFEVRIPFTGPERLSLLKSGFLLSDLNFFIDGGMAWTRNEQLGDPIFTLDQNGEPFINPVTGEPDVAFPQAKPVFTAGASVRVNLFGALVIEPFYAFPLVNGTRGVFGVNFLPGW